MIVESDFGGVRNVAVVDGEAVIETFDRAGDFAEKNKGENFCDRGFTGAVLPANDNVVGVGEYFPVGESFEIFPSKANDFHDIN